MEHELLKYINNNWGSVLSGIGTFFVFSITACWTIAKMWYTRQIAIKNAECEFLQKQINDKDSYVQGVIEVMDQRLNLAQEEPKRLLRLVEEKENQLLALKCEKDNLLQKIESSKDVNDIGHIISLMSVSSLRSSLRDTIELSKLIFPSHHLLNPLRKYFYSWDKSTKDQDTNFSEVASYLVLWTKVQTVQTAELDIGLRHCYRDLFDLKKSTYNSLAVMLKPFMKNKIPLANSFDFYLTKIPSHHLEYYLRFAEELEKKQKNKEENKAENDESENQFEITEIQI